MIINNGFDRLRKLYGGILRTSLQTRWVIYCGWAVLTLMCLPMFVLSPKELAPTEDQGVIFGIVDAPANYAIEETSRFTEKANDVFFSFPETSYSFQLTFPNGGFSGMILSPWSERERTVFDHTAASTDVAWRNPRHAHLPRHARGTARRQRLSRGFHHRLHRRACGDP